MQSYAEEWLQVFGIDPFQFNPVAGIGESASPGGPSYQEGTFDQTFVQRKLLELAYEEQEASGRNYYTTRKDYGQSLRDPGSRISLSAMNRVYIADDILIASPYTEFMTTMFDTMDGAVASLAEDPAFSTLAESLGDPLGAVLMDRQTVMNPDAGGLSVPDKEPGWGELHVWDALGGKVRAGRRRQLQDHFLPFLL